MPTPLLSPVAPSSALLHLSLPLPTFPPSLCLLSSFPVPRTPGRGASPLAAAAPASAGCPAHSPSAAHVRSRGPVSRRVFRQEHTALFSVVYTLPLAGVRSQRAAFLWGGGPRPGSNRLCLYSP